MNRIPLPAVIIVTMTAALLAGLVWSIMAAPDTSPPELPTLTAPAPEWEPTGEPVAPYPGPIDPYPAPPTVEAYPAPYPSPVYLPFAAGEGEAYP